MGETFIVLFGEKYSLTAGRELGYRLINIITKNSNNSGLNIEDMIAADKTIVLNDIDEIDTEVEKIVENNIVSGIISFTDRCDGVLLANRLSNKYLFDGNFTPNQSVDIVNNKYQMREHLDKIGLENIKFTKGKSKRKAIDIFCNIRKFGG